ncbi:ArnT family glycosyltransferase [Siphonobacter curvatus]|uniref:Glycosyltransferase RgtA/B/C/D-like domain-containing protein n=1 Tax=Siphonobacter curvatus TaxID=2094562 RepID=A0A2S7IQT9_9BACT|nr:glycosyltransferase family 39 protein [Siphonobacter curvatus]PQA60081.1 hypothetical protein C5O19_10830 [Siphonobacter curvatus]
MWDWLYRLLFLMFVGFCFRVAAQVSRKSLVDVIITAFTVFAGSIIVSGFVLSFLHKTADVRFWAGFVFIPPFIFYLLFSKVFIREYEDFSVISLLGSTLQKTWTWYKELSLYLKVVFGLMIVTLATVSFISLLLVLFTVPNEWDSMTGHLVRVMYFIQRGTMAPFYGTNWNIDTYPRSVCGIQIYSYLITGKIENAFKLINYLSYWISVLAAYGIAQSISRNTTASVFSALAMGLLPNVLLQSTTTDTDIVLMGYVSCLVYFLFAYHQTHRRRYLYLAGLIFGIGLGHKITLVLQFPSLFMVALYVFVFGVPNVKYSLGQLKHFFTSAVIGVLLFTLPTGYLSNLQRYNHPIGPPTATRHQSVERAGGIFSPNLYEQGTRNFLRYGFDFMNLDGLTNLPGVIEGPNQWFKAPFVWLEGKVHARLREETDFTIRPFSYNRDYIFMNGLPYWGIMGFALLWPLVFLVLFGVIRSKPLLFLAGAALLHAAALSYSAPYDPFKGRYFISTSIYVIPFLTVLFTKRHSLLGSRELTLKSYILFIVALACASAFFAVLWNERCLPVAHNGHPSAFDEGRIERMSYAREDITPAYKNFDRIVPEHATVALADINDDYEYPLFGKDLTRKLIPINPFERGLQPIPKEAEYLFFAASVIKPQPGDIRLGTDTTAATRAKMIVPAEDYWLRRLK